MRNVIIYAFENQKYKAAFNSDYSDPYELLYISIIKQYKTSQNYYLSQRHGSTIFNI